MRLAALTFELQRLWHGCHLVRGLVCLRGCLRQVARRSRTAAYAGQQQQADQQRGEIVPHRALREARRSRSPAEVLSTAREAGNGNGHTGIRALLPVWAGVTRDARATNTRTGPAPSTGSRATAARDFVVQAPRRNYRTFGRDGSRFTPYLPEGRSVCLGTLACAALGRGRCGLCFRGTQGPRKRARRCGSMPGAIED